MLLISKDLFQENIKSNSKQIQTSQNIHMIVRKW